MTQPDAKVVDEAHAVLGLRNVEDDDPDPEREAPHVPPGHVDELEGHPDQENGEPLEAPCVEAQG